MATNYIKCPKCDLNYIKPDEKYCKACNPEMRGKLLSDIIDEYEAYREKKWEEYKTHKDAMDSYYTIRYNRKPK